ncbi:MAG: polysaccharide deacetylase family protein [Bacteroidaceae bacterium]|nr:polysaccharide deacetylase family protein [Bacteroidaceae bacterium]
MNVLSFDIEEWYCEKAYDGDRRYKYVEYDKYLELILNKLEERNIKATFFCVGEMGRLFPDVVRKIADRGHEIGCHSNVHTWLNKMSVDECREDTHVAIDSLEQCVGQKILSYRAPAFSIGEGNKWAFEILAENGITRDSSVFPATRDFGGFPSFGCDGVCDIQAGDYTIKEFPIPMTKVLGKKVAFSGGGYFRFLPLWFVKSEMQKREYNLCYFHIGDLLPETNGVLTRKEYEDYFKEPGTLYNRYKRFAKSNIGKAGALKKMMNLIDSMEFVSLEHC